MTVACPKCGRQIPAASVNIVQDVAFCTPCGEVYKISALIGGETPPPSPVFAAPVQAPESGADMETLSVDEPPQTPVQAVPAPVPSDQPPVPPPLFCGQCGYQLTEGACFCAKCGSAVVGLAAPAAMAVSIPVQNAAYSGQPPAAQMPGTAPQRQQAPVQPVYQAPPQGAEPVAAPDTVLVKGLGDAWVFKPNETFSWNKMSGNFEVTPSCVRFVPSALLSFFLYSKKDSVTIPITNIVAVRKTGSLPQTIEIAVNSGHILKIQGYGAVKEALDIIKQLTGLQ